jgi:hypothetical protein
VVYAYPGVDELLEDGPKAKLPGMGAKPVTERSG